MHPVFAHQYCTFNTVSHGRTEKPLGVYSWYSSFRSHRNKSSPFWYWAKGRSTRIHYSDFKCHEQEFLPGTGDDMNPHYAGRFTSHILDLHFHYFFFHRLFKLCKAQYKIIYLAKNQNSSLGCFNGQSISWEEDICCPCLGNDRASSELDSYTVKGIAMLQAWKNSTSGIRHTIWGESKWTLSIQYMLFM